MLSQFLFYFYLVLFSLLLSRPPFTDVEREVEVNRTKKCKFVL